MIKKLNFFLFFSIFLLSCNSVMGLPFYIVGSSNQAGLVSCETSYGAFSATATTEYELLCSGDEGGNVDLKHNNVLVESFTIPKQRGIINYDVVIVPRRSSGSSKSSKKYDSSSETEISNILNMFSDLAAESFEVAPAPSQNSGSDDSSSNSELVIHSNDEIVLQESNIILEGGIALEIDLPKDEPVELGFFGKVWNWFTSWFK